MDAAGGGQFVETQAAIDAAQNGDRILVEPRGYDSFLINKGVSATRRRWLSLVSRVSQVSRWRELSPRRASFRCLRVPVPRIQSFAWEIDGGFSGVALWMHSDVGGEDPNARPQCGGQDLAVLPGRFFTQVASPTDAQGDLNVVASMADVPDLLGTPLHMQVALNDPVLR